MKWIALAVVAGCGRLGFDPIGVDGAGDSPPGSLAACSTDAIARYPFDGDPKDAIGNADGTAVGNVGFDNGRFAEAVLLDGIDDMIELPSTIGTDYTVVFWVRTSAIAPGTVDDFWFEGFSLVDAEVCGSPTGGDWGTSLIDGGHIAVEGIPEHSSATINDDVWRQIAYTRELATDGNAVYIDGIEAGRDDDGFPGEVHVSVPYIGVGNNPCRAGTGVDFFPGRIDEITLFDRSLSSTEISALRECQAGF